MHVPAKLQFISRFIGRQGLKLKGSAPTILTVGGIGAFIAAGVLAVRATPKMEEVVDDLGRDLDDVAGSRVTNEEEKAQLKIRVYATAASRMAVVYGPSIALAAAGTAAILYSHGMMKKRNAALVAAYGVLERGFQAYRDRVRESVGEDVERDIHRGHTMRISDVDLEKQVVTWEPTNPGAPTPRSEYAVDFGPDNPNWNGSHPDYNLVFLRTQERYANHKLQARGHVLLNDVYDSLGMPRTKEGCVVGWVKNGPDGYVDFGLPAAGSAEESDYFYFYDGEGQIFLDFNVDGLVYDKI